jgi:hypothetical protein
VRKTDLTKWQKYFDARNDGKTVEDAARIARISPSTAYRFERGDQASTGLEAAAVLGVTHVGGCLVDRPLSAQAYKALDDFAYFRLRYMGRKSTPWQERAAYELLRAHETDQREFIVMNEPPGSGKSTLFTHDIPCWLIARDRSIRIMIGSRTERQARMYVGRIKKTLEREAPLRANADDLIRGVAFDAEATMLEDFGLFKPEGRSDIWRSEALVVQQLDGTALDDKEPTVSAWGQDSGFLGGRFDFVVWDDLVDRKNVKTMEAREGIREWWDSEAESRLEPRGVLLLQGQRIANNDLYRYCLDKRNVDESPKYRHIVYKAHDEDLCPGEHSEKPWPEGCLLDPYRLPWKLLEQVAYQSPRQYQLIYQQKDATGGAGLVDEVWINGGVDDEGYPAPGCRDNERGLNDPPVHLIGDGWSFITVDPSPTEFWAVIWWLYDPDTDRRYIINLWRQRMNPEQFLTLDLETFEFTGLIPDITAMANDMNIPIQHVIVEVNAAQRWLLSQPHVHKWIDYTGQAFVPHTTSMNKRDPKFGFESIGDLFRQGQIRLPMGTSESRMRMGYLIQEAVNYPDYDTDDTLMAVWFQKLAIENHQPARAVGMYQMPRPPWVRQRERGMYAYS